MKTTNAPIPAMKTGFRIIATAAWLSAAVGISRGQGPVAPGELVAPRIEISGGNVNFTVQPSVNGRKYQLQATESLANGTWQNLGTVVTGNGNNLVISTPHLPGTPRRFYRLVLDPAPAAPPGTLVLIPAGSFSMGDKVGDVEGGDGETDEVPVHTVRVSAFWMQNTEVTNDQMVAVLDWAYLRGKLVVTTATVKNAAGNQQELLDLDDFDCRILWNPALSRFEMKAAKGSGYPCVELTWYGCAAYCNYRSEIEGLSPSYSFTDWSCNFAANGYRLPTEAEWERAARGGVAGRRFPWGDTISHAQVNYEVYSSNGTTNYYSYDVTPRPGYFANYYNHPTYATGGAPFTSPVGSFPPNGYGLHDMAGNVWEWCHDWYSGSYYSASPGTAPRGPSSGPGRVCRGGSWGSRAIAERCAYREYSYPGGNLLNDVGFRPARSSVP